MRILICEDSVLLREGLVRLLQDAGHEIVAALPDASELFQTVAETNPQLCILDVRLPPNYLDEGIRAAVALHKQRPEIAILVLSQYVEERYAGELLAGTSNGGGGRGGSAHSAGSSGAAAAGGAAGAAGQAGSTTPKDPAQQPAAIGYLLKDRVTDVAEFLTALERIAAGTNMFDPEVVAQLLVRQAANRKFAALTEREKQVLGLIAEGYSNQAIANALFLSNASIEKHISAIFLKLEIDHDQSSNRRVLAALAHISQER